jgi:translation initiation factor 2B subunit (eIF-2B alpha/beta/delta family)
LSQEKINQSVFKLIANHDVIFTYCHSTNVVNSLIYSHRKGKKFEVFNTETRPLFQGRKTAQELIREGIKVNMFVDSAMGLAISKKNYNNKNIVTKIFLGADALISEGAINKIGSNLIAEIASYHKIPVYIIADSWKFSKRKIPIEQRSLNEVWDKAPKKIKIQNPAFEFVPKKYIKAIVSEFGVLKFDEFLRRVGEG